LQEIMAESDDVFAGTIGLMMWNIQRRITREFTLGLTALGYPGALIPFLRAIEGSEGLTQGELAQRVFMRDSTTTRAVDELERLKLITRRRSPTDKRKMHLHLTAKGKTLCRRLGPMAARMNARILDGFSHEDSQKFQGYLKRIRRNLDRPPFDE
jgi:DNA-binding MarR family transcriptional regulator